MDIFLYNLQLYHGTDTEPELGQVSGYYPGTYSFTDKNDAEKWNKKNTYSTKIDINRIYNLDHGKADWLKSEARKLGFGHSNGNGSAEVQYLKSQGYIGMRRGNEIILFDTNQWNKI